MLRKSASRGDLGGGGDRRRRLDHRAERGAARAPGPPASAARDRGRTARTCSADSHHRQQDAQRRSRGRGRPAMARSWASSASGCASSSSSPRCGRAGEERRGLVAAEVEHADGRVAPGRARSRTGASARGGRPPPASCAASRKRELGAQQPDALGAGGEPGVELGARRGVDEHAHAAAVAGDGGQLAVARRLLARGAAARAWPRRAARDPRGGRTHDASPASPSTTQLVAVGDARAALGPEPDRHRQPERARDDGRVGRRARRRRARSRNAVRSSSATSAGPSSPATSTSPAARPPGRCRQRRSGSDCRAGPAARRRRAALARRPSERTSPARAASVGSSSAAMRAGVQLGRLERRRGRAAAALAAPPAATVGDRGAGPPPSARPVATISASAPRPAARAAPASASSSARGRVERRAGPRQLDAARRCARTRAADSSARSSDARSDRPPGPARPRRRAARSAISPRRRRARAPARSARPTSRPGPGDRRSARRGRRPGPCGPASARSPARPPRAASAAALERRVERRRRRRPPPAGRRRPGTSASTIVLSPGHPPRRGPATAATPRSSAVASAAPSTVGRVAQRPPDARAGAEPHSGPLAPPTVDTSVLPAEDQHACRAAAPPSWPASAASTAREPAVHVDPVVAVADRRVELGQVIGLRRDVGGGLAHPALTTRGLHGGRRRTIAHAPQRSAGGVHRSIPQRGQLVVELEQRERRAGHLQRRDVAADQPAGRLEPAARSLRSTSP